MNGRLRYIQIACLVLIGVGVLEVSLCAFFRAGAWWLVPLPVLAAYVVFLLGVFRGNQEATWVQVARVIWQKFFSQAKPALACLVAIIALDALMTALLVRCWPQERNQLFVQVYEGNPVPGHYKTGADVTLFHVFGTSRDTATVDVNGIARFGMEEAAPIRLTVIMQRRDKVQEGMLPVLNVPYLPYSYPIDVASIPDDSWLDTQAGAPLSEIHVVPATDSLASFRSTVRVGESTLAIQHAPWGTPLSRSDHVLIYRSAYVLNYSPETKTPRWVSYVLRATADRDSRPPSRFLPDPALREFAGSQASGEDYWQSGYDRGHLISLSDMMFRGTEGVRLASYFSTVAPQAPWTNRRLWAKLEQYGRHLADSGPVYILAGPVFAPVLGPRGIEGRNGFLAIGPHDVWVPSHFSGSLLAANPMALLMYWPFSSRTPPVARVIPLTWRPS